MEMRFFANVKISPDLIAIKNKKVNNYYKSNDIEFLDNKDKKKFESVLTSEVNLNFDGINEEKSEKNNVKFPVIQNLNTNVFEKGLKISSIIKKKFASKYFNS